MFIRASYSKEISIYLIIFLGILFMPITLQAVMPPPYSDSAPTSPIKAIALVKSVKAFGDYDSKVTFIVEKSFGDKTVQEFEAICPTSNYSPAKPGMTGGTLSYSPKEGDRVLVTVNSSNYVSSYTKVSLELDIELRNNGLKNISFSVGRAFIVRTTHQNTTKIEAKEMLEKGRTEWELGELGKALLSLEKAVILDPSNKKIVKVFKSMQLQKKKIDGLLKIASNFIEKNNYEEAKQSLEKATVISSQYKAYQIVLQKLEENDLIETRQIQMALRMMNVAKFQKTAANNYTEALLSFAQGKGMEKLHNIDQKLWSVELSQVGWKQFFDSSVRVYNKDFDKYPLVAYYNPFSDIFLITVWSQEKEGYKIIDAEILLGDLVRGTDKKVDVTPFWLREKKEYVASLGVGVAISTLAFESVFKRTTVKNWRTKLKILNDSSILNEANYPAVAKALSAQLLNVINFSSPDANMTQLKACRNLSEEILLEFQNGSLDRLLATHNETPVETAKLLSKVTPQWMENLTLSSVVNNVNECFVFFTPKQKSTGSLSFSFHTQKNNLRLKRIDLIEYQQIYTAVKSYLDNKTKRGI